MKTTAHHFKVFQKEVTRVLNLWAVLLWDLRIQHSADVDPNHAADCSADLYSRKAWIRLNTEWRNNTTISDAGIKETAVHEAIHLLLAPLADLADRRCVTMDQLKAGEHELLENLKRILPLKKLEDR